MQLHDLMAKLFELRQVAADQAKDGPSGSGAMARALTAYEWLGDNIEAFVAGLDPEMTEGPASQTEGVGGGAPYCDGAVAHIDIGGLLERHVEELRVHAAKLRWQMENDERPIPPHGWTCFHCAQTFTTWASASAHFGGDPLSGRPTCCASTQEAVERAIREWGEGPCDSLEDLTHAVRAALTPPETAEAVPVAWPNGCDRTVPEALRFLANNDRPSGGEQRFNSAHLYQLADEIEKASRLTIHPEAKCLREELEEMRQSVVIAKHSEAMAVRGRQMAQRELADAVKALETARSEAAEDERDRLFSVAIALSELDGRGAKFYRNAEAAVEFLLKNGAVPPTRRVVDRDTARSASSQGGE